MQFTISLTDLLVGFSVLLSLAVNAWLWYVGRLRKKAFEYEQAQKERARQNELAEKERMQQRFSQAFPFIRSQARFQTLIANGVQEHARVAPDDLRCMVTIYKHKDGIEQPFFHNDGVQTVTDWTTGNGREILLMLRDGLSNIERARPNFLRVLQPLLDEARDSIANTPSQSQS